MTMPGQASFSFRSMRRMQGFTLIEMMTVIVIMGILLALVVPSFDAYFEKSRTKRAAETLAAFLVNAKSESLKRNTTVRVVFQSASSGASWCAGMTAANTCDCSASPNTCQMDGVDRTVAGADFNGVVLSAPGDDFIYGFTHRRGTVNAQTIQLQSVSGYGMNVVVSSTGRIRLCSPSGTIGGYATC